jgi:hypothetical protein
MKLTSEGVVSCLIIVTSTTNHIFMHIWMQYPNKVETTIHDNIRESVT